jgi:hypothetical protein
MQKIKKIGDSLVFEWLISVGIQKIYYNNMIKPKTNNQIILWYGHSM